MYAFLWIWLKYVSLFLWRDLHIHNYTEYTEEWNVFSAFNPCAHTPGAVDTHTPHTHTHTHLEQWTHTHTHTHTQHTHTHTHTHTWSSGQPTQSWELRFKPTPQVTSPTLYPLGQLPHKLTGFKYQFSLVIWDISVSQRNVQNCVKLIKWHLFMS